MNVSAKIDRNVVLGVVIFGYCLSLAQLSLRNILLRILQSPDQYKGEEKL